MEYVACIGRYNCMKLPNTAFARRLGPLITRWTHTPTPNTTGYRYYGTCSAEGCDKEISLYKYTQRQEGNLRCRLCSKYRGKILGVPVYSARLWAHRNKIVEMRHDGTYWRAYKKCRVKGCAGTILFRHEKYRNAGKKYEGYCREHMKKRLRLRPYESRYNSFVHKAKRRGWEVTLSFNQYLKLFASDNCHYCLKPLTRAQHKLYGAKPEGADHIDRKDPRKGYTPTNCVPCCPPCNFAKNVYFTYEEMCVVGALRQGDVRKARRLALKMNTVANARKVQAIFDRVWKDRKGRAAVWKRKPKGGDEA